MISLSTNKEMVSYLEGIGVLKTPQVVSAFLSIDRKDFILPGQKSSTYNDKALPILGRQTISQPYTVAFMLELLEPQRGDNILDIGTGSGWTTALLSNIVGNDGFVTGVEIIQELVEFGKKNIEKYKLKNVKINQANKGVLGVPGESFDKILVNASAKSVPTELFSQLNIGGYLVIPINESIYKFKKTQKGIEEIEFPGFVFVPLV